MWGVVLGLVASILIVGIGRRVTGGDGIGLERRLRARRQLVIYAAAWLLMGVLAGFWSAVVGSAWPDLLLLVFLLLTAILLAGLVLNVRRRRA
jgi:hypothetical protein